MAILLLGFMHNHRYLSVAKTDEARDELARNGLSALCLSDGEIHVEPDGVCIPDSEGLYESLVCFSDFDVLEVCEDGRVLRRFSDKSTENTIFITGRCNSSCRMCPDSDKMRARASWPNIDELLEFVRYIPTDARHITITGGEPFLLGRDAFRLFEELKARLPHTVFQLLTNGRIFSVPSYCADLQRTLPPRTTIGIPIHGFDSRSHDAITQVEGSFDQTVAGVGNLLALGMSVELRVVVSKLNEGFVSRIAEFIAQNFRQVKCVKIMGLEMLGSAAKNRDDVWLSYPAAFKASRTAIVRLVESGIDVGLYNFPLCSVGDEFWPICEKSISSHKIRYAKACDDCIVKNACGGIFDSSLRFAEGDVLPVGSASNA